MMFDIAVTFIVLICIGFFLLFLSATFDRCGDKGPCWMCRLVDFVGWVWEWRERRRERKKRKDFPRARIK